MTKEDLVLEGAHAVMRITKREVDWNTAVRLSRCIVAMQDVSNNSIINDLTTEANRVRKDRGQEYDKDGQERNMKRIVDVFNAFHDTELTESQGWHFMQILKDVRLLNAPEFHHDSAVDGLNYHLLKCEALHNK